ncbi:DUF927 domain-containing protein [Gulbenkiania mobilis]|uniref:DNA primase/helicase n=1 Tax=Gulbenkiania mobilis TaxID=397457 RepID=A0ABY2CU05_GULMO|nr:putative DNA primase/helicase [Gulbenkiania mobilis]
MNAPYHSPEAALLGAMRAAGIAPVVKAVLSFDGKVCRFDLEGRKRGKKHGWFVGHTEGLDAWGCFGDWSTGFQQSWSLRNRQTMSESERIDLERRITEARMAAEAERQRLATIATEKAQTNWERGHDISANHPYLLAKGIIPYGARQLRDMLLVPACIDGKIVTMQYIGKDGTKTFQTGGRTKGASLVLGRLKDAAIVLVCEGWATGCTLHQATGLPVVVAFNAHNLIAVAERLAASLPADVAVLVCGDSDASLTGQQAASKAAMSLYPRGRAIVPTFTDSQLEAYRQQHGDKLPSDFNDLAQLAGIEEVSASVNAELSKIDGNNGNNGNMTLQANNDGGLSESELFPLAENWNGNNGKNDVKSSIPSGFLLVSNGERPGVYWLDPDGEKPPRWVCSPLTVDAKTRDERGSNWGRLLSWRDAERRLHRWAMPSELTCGDGAELAKELVRGGLDVDPTRKARELLNAYLVRSTPPQLVRCTNRTGWHGDAFVLHDEVIGKLDGEDVFLQSERDETLGMVQAGSLDDWRENVAKLASGNSRLVFALSLAFAAPLAELANESGGFHIVGTSSAGKSTALEAAASVWGRPADYGYKWRATSNGLEGLCASRNDLLVILDELAQVDPREAGESAYLISNGQGKARASRNGSMRTPARWRVLLLSAGEISLGQHMQEAGKQTRAGQEVRLIDIAADAGAGLGMFDVLHDEASGAALSQRIKESARRYHGTAGRDFLRKLTEERREDVSDTIRDGIATFIADDVPSDASGQVIRAASRFALVAVAGEIATAWGLTGWQQGEAMASAIRLFREWIGSRGGAGDAETREGLAAVRAFLETHGESRFTSWDADPATAARTINRAGFRRMEDDGLWFYVLPAAFQREMCRGVSHSLVAKAMAGKGWLKTQAKDRFTFKARLPGMGAKPSNVYLVTPAVWEDE